MRDAINKESVNTEQLKSVARDGSYDRSMETA